MNPLQKRTWAEISLDNLTHNYRVLRELLPRDCKYLGVVKADAYGHGAVRVARKLQLLGADYLGVACLDEALELRHNGIGSPILILGHTPPEFGAELLENDLTQTIFDLETAKKLSTIAVAMKKNLKIHVKVDTGMSRFGFVAESAEEPIATLCALPNLKAEGIFTHFANADSDEDYTMAQFTKFLDLLDKLAARGITFDIRHCAASAAVLNYPCTYLDMVRPGIVLYGHYPDPAMEGMTDVPLLPVMTLKTRVASVKTLPKGTKISYGCTHTLARDSRVAVLTLGYADGFSRSLSDCAHVEIGGKLCPVLGRICMDLCMVDVTDAGEVAPGSEVTVFGQNLPIETLAAQAGTIPYELLCAVSKRIPRCY
ncbi:MAG: alanine racemase [Oscillospiraceae bacterium]